MRKTVIAAILIALWIAIGDGLTNLDYSLSTTKTGSAAIAGDTGYHGPSSVRLALYEGGRSKSITIDFEESMSLHSLDQFAFMMKPESGSATLELEIRLDGDGDGSSDSKNPADAVLKSQVYSWTPATQQSWREADAFDLQFEGTSQDPSKKFKALDYPGCQEKLRGLEVVKIYLRLKKVGSENCSGYIDYLRLGEEVVSFEPLEDEEVKRSKQRSISPGSSITYVITYGNNLNENVTNLVIQEMYDARTVYVESYPPPDPGTNNRWTIGRLGPGEHGQIVIKVQTHRLKCNAEMDGRVQGVGYSSVRRKMTSEQPGYQVTNRVVISCASFNMSDSATTIVKPWAGFSTTFNEHGSGSYNSQEEISMSSTTLGMERKFAAVQFATAVNLSGGGAVLFNSSWGADQSCTNERRETLFWEQYRYADKLNLSGSAGLRSSRPFLDSAADFQGTAEMGRLYRDRMLLQRFVGNFSMESNSRAEETSKKARTVLDYIMCCEI
ncbi:MAG: DUF11 domain-containing protein [Methanosarcinales archaeon]|nr:DUF11 domain-containing protein [Methanosarcinales archaeon]